MRFADALHIFSTILENGPLTTRLVYEHNYKDGAFKAISDPKGQQALAKIYQDDIDIAQTHHLPIIINAPTFRASQNYLPPTVNIRRVNLDCLEFTRQIKAMYPSLDDAPIFIGAPLGSMNDAYTVDSTLTMEAAHAYHQAQIDIFKEAEVDLVNVLTISSFNEALGIALAAQQADLDYTLGFILNEDGTLLDGTPLHEAIQKLDAATTKKPLGYVITCTHTSIIAKLNKTHPEYQRLIGAQTNGSNLSPQQLTKMTTAVADEPAKFAEDMQEIKEKLGLIIVAGCCGTTKEHLEAMAEKFRKESYVKLNLVHALRSKLK